MKPLTVIFIFALSFMISAAVAAPIHDNQEESPVEQDGTFLIPSESFEEPEVLLVAEDHHEPAVYVPAASHEVKADLKPAATGYGGGYDVSGYLDKGAYTGGYGAFGWYAHYPVGGRHH
ncbi:uncharacterized protein LOC143239814 [Tachypleus tridentatus]|uniref:uncharacterized protein LOC143239814 n=1 Tax=Tachypleus tridentatus TaxID=6853 RepID=UPI003FD42462